MQDSSSSLFVEGARYFNQRAFYIRYAWFQFRERFTDVGSSVAYMLLYPFFIWLLTRMWGKFNAYQGNYSRDEIFVYVSITELLFFSFLRSGFMNRSGADFSLSLARPRSWLVMTFSGQYGSTLGGRLLYSLIAVVMLPCFGVSVGLVAEAFLRVLIFLPFLGLIEAFMASMLGSAQILWHQTKYLMLPITKIFLALGGVFGPLADYGEPGRSIFLKLPASDLFFQVGHFCVKGSFYRITEVEWFSRIVGWTVFFAILNLLFFRFAKKNHQGYGG